MLREYYNTLSNEGKRQLLADLSTELDLSREYIRVMWVIRNQIPEIHKEFIKNLINNKNKQYEVRKCNNKEN